MTIFSNGTWKELKTLIPNGSYIAPISKLGIIYYEKTPKKSLKTSKIINKAIPHRKPSSTIEVWRPWILPSRLISRHHWIITNNNSLIPKKNKVIDSKWNQETIPVVKYKPPIEPNKGHGDSSTIW